MIEVFWVTEQHLKLMQSMNVGYNHRTEFGAPEIDPKRPYGNSSVYHDIADILGISPKGEEVEPGYIEFTEAQKSEMLELHKETETALQIALATGTFEVGRYETPVYQRKWKQV